MTRLCIKLRAGFLECPQERTICMRSYPHLVIIYHIMLQMSRLTRWDIEIEIKREKLYKNTARKRESEKARRV